ncbi:hypothetical protein R84B8_02740 [Treponema sp. R8-4-B8]
MMLGPGAGGGGSGSFSMSSAVGSGDYSAPGGTGGAGGGFGGGSAGAAAGNGGSAASFLSSNSSVAGGQGAASYSASDFNISPNIAFLMAYPSGTFNLSSYPSPQNTSDRAASVRTVFSFSGNSGLGGSAASLSYPTGPQSWLHCAGLGGAGASSQSLDPVSVTGSASVSTSSNLTPNAWTSSSVFSTPVISLVVGNAKAAQNGSDGGNNRNETRGGGSASGAAGSIVIHKIY